MSGGRDSRRLRSPPGVVAVALALAAAAALLAAVIASGAGVVAADTAAISVTGPDGETSIDGDEGETITVTVGVNASDASAYQAALAFDPDVIRVESVSGTDDFGDPVVRVDEADGRVAFNQYRSSTVEDPRLATLTLEVVGDGGDWTSVSFVESDTMLSDDVGREQGIDRHDGLTVTVESEPTRTGAAVPGFGATTVLLAGLTMYGLLRFRRR